MRTFSYCVDQKISISLPNNAEASSNSLYLVTITFFTGSHGKFAVRLVLPLKIFLASQLS